MTNAPKELWSRTEADEPVFTRDELHRWPAEELARLTRMGLLRETGKADYFICDNCGDPHSAEVIWIYNVRSPAGISPIIGCPGVGAVDVDSERLRQWVVDIPKLAELASASL